MRQEEIQDYARRWSVAAEREMEELRSTPFAVKFAQLAALMASARALGWETTSHEEIDAVRERWRKLRQNIRV